MSHARSRLTRIVRFYTTYHPYFSILPRKEIILARFQSQKLLPWAILAVAAGGSVQLQSLYNSLVDPVRRLAGDIYSHQSRGLEAVQALLLLCAWPFPYQQTINDPSPTYAAQATNIALQIGLHRPDFYSDFEYGPRKSENLELERERAWYGCFIISHAYV